MSKLTPVLQADDLLPSRAFWVDRLGFESVVELPEDGPGGSGPLGFSMLQKDGAMVMLQSRGSVANDLPDLAKGPLAKDGVMLFFEIDDLDDIIARTKGCEIVVDERTTFYGMREIAVREPSGIVVVFAQRVGES